MQILMLLRLATNWRSTIAVFLSERSKNPRSQRPNRKNTRRVCYPPENSGYDFERGMRRLALRNERFRKGIAAKRAETNYPIMCDQFLLRMQIAAPITASWDWYFCASSHALSHRPPYRY